MNLASKSGEIYIETSPCRVEMYWFSDRKQPDIQPKRVQDSLKHGWKFEVSWPNPSRVWMNLTSKSGEICVKMTAFQPDAAHICNKNASIQTENCVKTTRFPTETDPTLLKIWVKTMAFQAIPAPISKQNCITSTAKSENFGVDMSFSGKKYVLK